MSYLAKNYNRKKISFTKGKGSYLYTSKGVKYLDFVQGIAVNCLGHAHPKLVKTIQNQLQEKKSSNQTKEYCTSTHKTRPKILVHP